ncbi:MAG: sugar phosphate isomerase/epimerase family protein [Geminicoccaceae bacterium]
MKDAEFSKNGRTGFWGGYQNWPPRRFRSFGDGDIDFGTVFSKLAEIDYEGWAVVEWECCIKDPHNGAREGAAFVRDHLIKVQPRASDANMQAKRADDERNRMNLGLRNP